MGAPQMKDRGKGSQSYGRIVERDVNCLMAVRACKKMSWLPFVFSSSAHSPLSPLSVHKSTNWSAAVDVVVDEVRETTIPHMVVVEEKEQPFDDSRSTTGLPLFYFFFFTSATRAQTNHTRTIFVGSSNSKECHCLFETLPREFIGDMEINGRYSFWISRPYTRGL